jgi:hypothetical protein
MKKGNAILALAFMSACALQGAPAKEPYYLRVFKRLVRKPGSFRPDYIVAYFPELLTHKDEGGKTLLHHLLEQKRMNEARYFLEPYTTNLTEAQKKAFNDAFHKVKIVCDEAGCYPAVGQYFDQLRSRLEAMRVALYSEFGDFYGLLDVLEEVASLELPPDATMKDVLELYKVLQDRERNFFEYYYAGDGMDVKRAKNS